MQFILTKNDLAFTHLGIILLEMAFTQFLCWRISALLAKSYVDIARDQLTAAAVQPHR